MKPVQQLGGTVTIQGAPLLAAAYRAVLLGIRQRRHDGLPSSDLQQLARALYRAHTEAASQTRHEVAPGGNDPPRLNGQDPSDLISVADAAGLLRLSKRQVQRLAASPGGLDGVRVGRTWALAKAPVLALAERRARDRRPDGLPG
jgi:hypothetical protein